MAIATLADVSLYYEIHGVGTPIVWCHEYSGDYRSWAPQLTAFSRQYQNIVYSACGYPGSSAPDRADDYSQDLMIEDLLQLLDHLGIERAVIAGLSMGANVALNFGIRHPERCSALVVAGCGSGSSNPEQFEANTLATLSLIEHDGMAGLAASLRENPTRQTMLNRDPAGFAGLCARLLDRTPATAMHIYRGVQLKRPSIFSLEHQMRAIQLPSLIIFGDRDEPCVEPGLFMWRTLPHSRLAVFPATGHVVNLEEPELFNAVVRAFLSEELR